LGSLWGGMNSWFDHEFMVYSMASISANIINNLENSIRPCRSWCWLVV
jgi:hypothetical protein